MRRPPFSEFTFLATPLLYCVSELIYVQRSFVRNLMGRKNIGSATRLHWTTSAHLTTTPADTEPCARQELSN